MTTKECRKCGIKKTLDEYNSDKKGVHGKKETCKECIKVYRKEFYAKNIDRNLERNRKYREANREDIRERQNKFYAENREKIRESRREYDANNKDKRNARSAVARAIKSGILVIPKECQSVIDDGSCDYSLEAHHYAGYEEKNWLKVVFLCTKCHHKEHSDKYDSVIGEYDGN